MEAAEPHASRWLAHTQMPPPFGVPASLEAWSTQRSKIRSKLIELLGELPPRPPLTAFEITSREDKGSYTHETFRFDNGAGEIVRGHVFLPESASSECPAPAILYCHWHGGQYEIGKDELLGTNATPVPPGPALASAGYVVLGIDAPCFGERHGAGPDGPTQTGEAGELSAAKFHLWAGRTLWGMILRDDLSALDYLCARPEVDAKRIGVTGISMGSTRSWWLAALDERLKTAVCVGCMTRYEDLIRAGGLREHGIYYFVPGMLRNFDTEAVISLCAPRAVLFMTGDQDTGSPVNGVMHIDRIVSRIYALYGEIAVGAFRNIIYPDVGHTYLPEMWSHTLQWLDRVLK